MADPKRELILGDCLEVLKALPENSVDSVVTDPPYELTSARPGGRSPATKGKVMKGFMGMAWDGTGIAFSADLWREILRVMKPGAHLLAFGGTRTYHRMACAIEDAGFEIRDQMQWLYGTGFPKSRDISKDIDKAAGAEREVVGKYQPPEMEKPWNLQNAKDERSVEMFASSRNNLDITAPATPDAEKWSGWGTALKPANEPIVVARKPLSEKTVTANVLKWGTGALNIKACLVSTDESLNGGAYSKDKKDDGEWGTMHRSTGKDFVQPKGRWPANVLHDGSPEVLEAFPNAPGQMAESVEDGKEQDNQVYGKMKRGGPHHTPRQEADKSAARFFYRASMTDEELEEQCRIASAAIVESLFALSKNLGVFALSDAVIVASQGAKRLSDVLGLSMNVTPIESKKLAEGLIIAILFSERKPSPERWPVKPIHYDGHAKVVVAQEPTGIMTITISHWKSDGSADDAIFVITPMNLGLGEKASQSVNRFMYCAKASRSEREAGLEGLEVADRETPMAGRGQAGLKCRHCGKWKASGSPCVCPSPDFEQIPFQRPEVKNSHPTVKPVALMTYLCRLVTPPGGVVLDPFCGSGTTGLAAKDLGLGCVLIEREKEYFEIAKARLTAKREPGD